MKFTLSQSQAYSRIRAMAQCHFSPPAALEALLIQPRLLPLLVGPTGVGKTALAIQLAHDLGAQFVRVPAADWIPRCSKHGLNGTLSQIAAAREHGKAVVFLDELDKFAAPDDNAWYSYLAAELYQLLDEAQSDRRMFVVGAGTWQRMHDEPGKRTMGFSQNDAEPFSAARLNRGECGIPRELLLRFSTPLIQLNYPAPAETATLMIELGLTKAAAEVGMTLDPSAHEWVGGMRSLECLATEITLRAFAKITPQQEREVEPVAQVPETPAKLPEQIRAKVKPARQAQRAIDWLYEVLDYERRMLCADSAD